MADTDVGNLKVGIGLDTSNLEKGINKATKSLDTLASSVKENTNKSANELKTFATRLNQNNQAIEKFATKSAKATRNQAIYIAKALEKVDTSIKKSANNISTMTALIVQKFNHLERQLDILYTLGQRDYASGFRRLEKTMKQSSPKISLDLKRIQTQADSTYNSLGKLSKARGLSDNLVSLGTNRIELPQMVTPNANFASGLRDANIQANSLTSSLMQTWHTLSMISFQVYLFQQGLQQVSNLVETFVAPGWEFAKAMETNEVGMAGILSSMTKIGERELEWNEAMSISKSIIKDLNIEAVRTAATTEELVGTFRALLGPGLGANFSIDEIKDFTVIGVNAVKSMGLEGRQLVQELRDLVQGGIQSASSTLATALGLTDKDIKEAKNSSEGLFKFLMARLRGFESSADATAETLKGLESIVTEGYVLASAEALQPVMNKYRDLLKDVANVMFAKDSFTLNPQFVDGFKDVAEYSLMFLENTKEVVVAFKPLGELLVKTVVPSLKFIAEYSDIIVALWGSMFVGQKLGNFASSFGVIRGEMGKTVTTQYAVSEALNISNDRYRSLMQTALDTGKTLVSEHNAEQKAINQRVKSTEIAHKLESQGNSELAGTIRGLYKHYRDLGISAEVASQLQYESAKIAESGNADLVKSVKEKTTAIIKDSKEQFKNSQQLQESDNRAERLAQKYALVASRVEAVGIALSGAGVLLGWFADEENQTAQEMASIAVQGGMVLVAFSNIIQAIPSLKDGFEGLKTKVQELNAVLTKLGGFGSVLKVLGSSLGIGLGVGVATAGVYAATHDISRDEAVSRYFDSREEKEKKQAEKAKAERDKKEQEQRLNNAKKLSSQLKVRQNKDVGQDVIVHIRSQYKKLEQELKTALAPLKELQKEYDHIYKYDLMSTQNYIESKFELQTRAVDIEIENLKKRRAVAQEQGQLADVDNFNTQIERLGVEKENLKKEAIRQLVDEYKKLDDRLFNIKKEFEGLVGVSEKAFEENIVKEYGETIVRVQTELKTANEYLNKAISSGNTEEIGLWETRKKSYQDAETRLKEIISLKKMEYDATKALAEAERVNLGLQEKYLEIQGKADRLEISNLNAESQMYEERQKNLDTYIDHYTTTIAQYEAMANKATTTEQYNQYKKMALEAREELNALLNEIHPLQQAIQEEFIGSLSDMFQNMLWQEKTAKEALKDFAKSVMQTFTKQVFDNFANQMASMIFPKNISNEKQNEIKETINVKIQGIDTSSLVESIFSTSQKVQQGLLPSFQALAEVTTALTNKMWELYNNIPNGGTPNGGEGNVPNGGLNFDLGNGGLGTNSEGTKPTISIGDVTLPENSLGSINDLSSQANDATISLSSLTKSTKATTGATDENTNATASDTLATATMVTTMLNATGVLGKFGTVLQGVMMAMQIAKTAGILGFAEGGYISGPGTGTSDSIPARLSNGEYVVRAGAVKQLGVGFLDQLNNIDRSGVKRSSRLPKFAYAEGGYVNAEMGGETQSSTPSVTGGIAQPTVVMQMTFQSLDPEANMKLMEAQYPQIRSRLIRDLQSNSSVRTAVKGVTK